MHECVVTEETEQDKDPVYFCRDIIDVTVKHTSKCVCIPKAKLVVIHNINLYNFTLISGSP